MRIIYFSRLLQFASSKITVFIVNCTWKDDNFRVRILDNDRPNELLDRKPERTKIAPAVYENSPPIHKAQQPQFSTLLQFGTSDFDQMKSSSMQ